MNVLFLSPGFPPHHWQFCTALRARGVTVVGVGDTPPSELPEALHGALTEYQHVPDMTRYEEVHRAVAYLIWRHGRIDRLDSHSEHWLPLEARLREDFNVAGLRPAQTTLQCSKHGMASLFRTANIAHPEDEPVKDLAQVRRFAKAHGFPLILKPDVGVGAARTWRVNDDAELEAVFAQPLQGYIVQPFIVGRITTYDGLVDGEGRIVFATSHRYDRGLMEILNEGLDGYYWSRRELPPKLEEVGQRAVAAFGLRERFFHAEFFELADGRYFALEMNLRPPGGFTTELMNYACDIDVYALWADMIAGRDVSGFRYERRHHTAHAGRRHGRRYAIGHDNLVASLGSTLVLTCPIPPIFAPSMGDVMYLLRHDDEEGLLEAVSRVQRPA